MKLFLLIPYIASLINSSPILNQNNQANGTVFGSVDNNLKQCYQCDFPIDDFTNASRLFNDNCINQIVTCNNNLCGSSLVKNQINGNYTIKLGCALDNNCPEVIDEDTEYPEKTEDNYIHCCDDSNLCNDDTTIKDILPFDLGNNSYFTNDYAPFNQTINTQEEVSNLLHDFYLPENYLNKSCIYKVTFTNKNNLIITLKKNNCSKRPVVLLHRDSLPAFPSQPLIKISLLDNKTKMIHDLVSSNTFITNFNYISDKNLLLFIADNNVFVYKLNEDNYQLTKITQSYLNYNPVDMKVNYNGDILTVASKTKVYFYNINNIEETKELITTNHLLGTNIYKIKYAPNRNVLLVMSYNKWKIYSQIYSLQKHNKINNLGSIKEKKRDSRNINLENIKYNPYKLDFYYGKYAISPVDNFIINYSFMDRYLNLNWFFLYTIRRIEAGFGYSCFGYKSGLFCDYAWNDNDNSTISHNPNDCFTAHYYDGHYIKLAMPIDYFFATDKPILALFFLSTKHQVHLLLKDTRSKYYPPQKKHAKKTDNSKKIVDNAYGGSFNNDSSKIVVFNHNRIQIYAINLNNNEQQTTTEMPTTENINTEKQTTSLPTSSQTTSTKKQKKQTTNSILTTPSSELANSSSTTNTSHPY